MPKPTALMTAAEEARRLWPPPPALWLRHSSATTSATSQWNVMASLVRYLGRLFVKKTNARVRPKETKRESWVKKRDPHKGTR